MKKKPLLLSFVAAIVGACAAGSNVDSIDPFEDPPIDGSRVSDASGGDGSSNDASSGDGGDTDGGDLDASGDSGGGAPTSDAFPTGTVSYFDGPCPNGWVAYPTAVGRTIVPKNDGPTLLATGTPFASGENRQHDHSVDLSFNLTGVRYVLASGGANGGLGMTGAVTMATTSAGTSAVVPYLQLMACKKADPPNGLAVQTGTGAFFEEATCPSGWTEMPATKGRILIGLPSGGLPNADFGAASLSSGELRDHTHPVAGNFTPAAHGISGASGCCSDYYAERKSYAYSATSGVSDVTPPYVTLTFCRKN